MLNNEGNAEIIGVVLLISIFIAAVSLMGVAMLSSPQPEKVPAVAFDFWSDDTHTNVALVHRGGETLNLNGTVLKVIYSDGTTSDNPSVSIDGGNPDSWTHVVSSSSSSYKIGDVINLTSPAGSIDQVQLIWPGTGGASMTGGGGPVLLGAWFPNSSSGRSPPAPVTSAVPITFPYATERPIPMQTSTPGPLDVYFIANITGTNGTLPINFTDLTENRDGYPLRIWNFSDGDAVYDYSSFFTHSYPTPISAPFKNYTVTLYRTDGTITTQNQPNLSRFQYVTAYQKPVANFIPSPTEGNAPLNVSFTDTSGGYVSHWSWVFGDGNTAVTNQSAWHIYTTNGFYAVVLTASNPFEVAPPSSPQIITVHRPLIADFTESPNPGVAGSPVQFLDQSTGDTLTGWSWNFGDGATSTVQNATHIYATNGTYNVSLTITNPWGTNTITKPFNVISAPLAPPVANFTATPMNGTAPLTVHFTDTSTNTPTTWFWNFGDGTNSTVQNPVHTYSTFGAYAVTLTATNIAGSNTSAPQTITVYNNLDTIRVNAGGPAYTDKLNNAWLADQQYAPGGWGYTPASSGPTFQTGASIINTSDPALYQIERNHTGTLEYQFNVPNKDYNVQLRFAEIDPAVSAGNPRTFNVMVNGNPVASNFNIYGTVGANTTKDLYTNVTVTSNLIDVVLSGVTGQPPMISAIGVAPASTWVSPAFTANQTAGNAQLPVQFTDTSTGTVNRWYWDFGDGQVSGAQNPAHTYAAPGTYKVMLTAGNANQSRTFVRPNYITVGPTLAANFTANHTAGIAPFNVSFTDTSTGSGLTNWSWNFGDGTTSTVQNATHTYTTAGTYTVNLTISNPYGSASITKTGFITVHSLNPDFRGNQTTGNAPLTVAFTDTSTRDIGIDTWTWTFGDGNTSTTQNPVFQYQRNGTYDVSLRITNTTLGTNSTTKLGYITVLPQLVPNFTANTTAGNAQLPVKFTDTSTGASIGGWTWNFGDGNTATTQNPAHIYATAGTYTVTLTVNNTYGSASTTKTGFITVRPPLVAAFGGAPLIGNAQQLNVSFADQSSGYSISGWTWSFGDGTTSTTQNPSHIYTTAGTYTVNLTITNPYGTASISRPAFVTVLPQLVPNFTTNMTAGNAQLPVKFTDTSTGTGINGWNWDFGDNSTASTQSPSHTYTTAGTYTVNLTVSNSYGNATVTRTGLITVLHPLVATFIGTPTVGNGQVNVQFTDQSTGDAITSRTWTFGDGNTSTAQNPSHIYTTNGSYNVTLTVVNAFGSSTFTRTRYITVYPPLIADFTATPTTGQAPLVVDFTDTSTGYNIIGWSWDFGDGSPMASLQDVSHTYTTAGTYTATLVVTNPFGSAQITKTITVTAPVTTPTPAGAAIIGTIYNDQNGDGAANTGDPKLAGWTINLLQNNVVIATTTSDASGAYGFYGLQNGKKYYVVEVLPVGWQGTNPAGGRSAEIHITGNNQVTTNFWNYYKPVTAGGTFNLNSGKKGSMLAGGYLQFRDTVSYSGTGVTIGSTFHHVNVGDTVRLYIESDGRANLGASSGGIWGFTVPDATLSINGAVVQRGAVTAISIHGYDSLQSTLVVTVPSQNAWTSFTVNGAPVIPGQSDSRIINLYNVTFTPAGTINLSIDPALTNVYIDASAGSYQLLP